MQYQCARILAILSSAAFAAGALAQSPLGPPYREVPGSMEFSGRLIVRPLQGAAGVNAAQPSSPQSARGLVAPFVREYIEALDEYVLDVPKGQTENELGEQLWKTGLFEWVRPDWILYPAGACQTIPNDPTFNQQWHLAKIQAPQAWCISTGMPNIIVATVDTGVDLNHPDLTPILVPGYCSYILSRHAQTTGGNWDNIVMDVNGHGTMVAGAAAAAGNNGIGGCGVGWNLRLMPIRASGTGSGSASFGDLQNGALWASTNGAKVVNVSYAGVADPGVETLGATLRGRGVLLVWAMDDNGTNFGTTFDHQHVTVVSGTDQNDSRASFSSFGLGVDIAAPAVSIWTPTLGGGYGYGSGNSYASPQVAGCLGVVWGLNPSLPPDAVEKILLDGADDIGIAGQDNFFGSGRVNLHTALWLGVIREFCEGRPLSNYNGAAFGIDDLYDTAQLTLDINEDGSLDAKDAQCVRAFVRDHENKRMQAARP